MEHFAPTINVNGRTITPKGHEWVLGFALAGCSWAIEKVSEPKFLAMIKADLTQETIAQLEAAISSYELKITDLKDDLSKIKN